MILRAIAAATYSGYHHYGAQHWLGRGLVLVTICTSSTNNHNTDFT